MTFNVEEQHETPDGKIEPINVNTPDKLVQHYHLGMKAIKP